MFCSLSSALAPGMLCALAANARKSKERTMGTTALSPVTPTTSEQQEGVTISNARWGDTQQWDKFASLFHDDTVVIIDAGPRPNPEVDPRIEVHGREAFIAGQSASLDGVHTAHNVTEED
jgi:hypothetical protein